MAESGVSRETLCISSVGVPAVPDGFTPVKHTGLNMGPSVVPNKSKLSRIDLHFKSIILSVNDTLSVFNLAIACDNNLSSACNIVMFCLFSWELIWIVFSWPSLLSIFSRRWIIVCNISVFIIDVDTGNPGDIMWVHIVWGGGVHRGSQMSDQSDRCYFEEYPVKRSYWPPFSF